MKEVAIRPFTDADRPAVVAMLDGLTEFERAIHWTRRPGSEVAAPYVAMLEETVAKQAGAIFVAEAGGEAVGFVCCWVTFEDDLVLVPEARRYGYIADIFVAEALRGGGLAQRLLAAAESHLAGQGMARVLIGSLAVNARACAAYEKSGYRPYEVVLEKDLEPKGTRR